jgi:hypothetical protein
MSMPAQDEKVDSLATISGGNDAREELARLVGSVSQERIIPNALDDLLASAHPAEKRPPIPRVAKRRVVRDDHDISHGVRQTVDLRG